MQKNDKSFLIQDRFIKQLHCMSELSDVLTVRLVEVEERLEVLEKSYLVRESLVCKPSSELLIESAIKLRNLKKRINA